MGLMKFTLDVTLEHFFISIFNFTKVIYDKPNTFTFVHLFNYQIGRGLSNQQEKNKYLKYMFNIYYNDNKD